MLNHISLVMPHSMNSRIWINTGSCTSLLSDATKPLSETMRNITINYTLKKTFYDIFLNWNIFILENAYENVIHFFFFFLMSDILFSPFWGWNWNVPGERGQYHGCWWPGYLCSQGISNHDIDCVGWMSPCLLQGGISTASTSPCREMAENASVSYVSWNYFSTSINQ